ncbi:cation:proton antiporter [Verrucomicrobia bacterium]|nr:cation:proton antiporter [Verrucomicrobiota bacterium]
MIPLHILSMIDEAFIRNLGLIVGIGTVAALVARAIRLPMLIGFLLAGLFLGPFRGLVHVSESLHLITETGIVLLLFLVGLELHIDRIKDVGIRALLIGFGQVFITTTAAWGLCSALGMSGVEAFFIAIAITLSSTVVVVKMLADTRETQTLFGKISLAVLLVQDLVVVIILTLLTAFSTGDELTAMEITKKVATALGSIALVGGLVIVSARTILPKAMTWASRSPNTLFIWSLCWCFLVVFVSHLLNLSPEIGAFLAGVSLAQLPISHDLYRRVNPLMNLFLAVFFVTLGIDMDFSNLNAIWKPALALSLFVLLAKPIIVAFLIRRMGYQPRTALLSGITLGQISEFSFILIGLALAAGFATPDLKALITLIGLLTLSISSCITTLKHPLVDFLARKGWFGLAADSEPSVTAPTTPAQEGHIIIVGMNTLGRLIVKELNALGHNLLAVDTDLKKLSKLPCRKFHGDISSSSALEETSFSKASLVISTLQIEDVNSLLAYHCRCLDIKCSIHAIDLSMVADLLEMDPSYLMLPKVDGIKLQNKKLQEMGILP